MLDFKKHGSKILTIIVSVISCASLALSVVALNNSRKQMHGEHSKCAQEAPNAKDNGMKHPKHEHKHNCDEKNPQMKNKGNCENPQKDQCNPKNETEGKKSDK